MTQSNTTAPQPPNPDPLHSDPSRDSDSLFHLHKMSTTAGLGSQDYAAVNVTAVVAVLFGLASLGAIASSILLVFPVVGVALSLIALRQVRRSNGTQTGAGLAILGLVFSGLITAVIFAYQGIQTLHQRADEQSIATLCQQYGQYLDQRNFDKAYTLFDSDFQNRVGKQTFVNTLSSMQNQAIVPPIDKVDWNGVSPVFQVDDSGILHAGAVIIVHYKGYDANQPRLEIHFKKSGPGDTWLIDNIPDHFPAPKHPAPAQ